MPVNRRATLSNSKETHKIDFTELLFTALAFKLLAFTQQIAFVDFIFNENRGETRGICSLLVLGVGNITHNSRTMTV
jgi:hypothetical protein